MISLSQRGVSALNFHRRSGGSNFMRAAVTHHFVERSCRPVEREWANGRRTCCYGHSVKTQRDPVLLGYEFCPHDTTYVRAESAERLPPWAIFHKYFVTVPQNYEIMRLKNWTLLQVPMPKQVYQYYLQWFLLYLLVTVAEYPWNI